MVAEVEEETELVVTVKLALVPPTGMVTEGGTTADPLLLDSETLTPPDGAPPVRLTVPVATALPVTLAGLTDNDESATPSTDVSGSVTLEFAAITTLS